MKYLPVVLLLVLTSCATATLDSEFSFIPDDGAALVVIKAPQTSIETYLNFKEVDIANQSFVDNRFRFALNWIYARKLTRPEGGPKQLMEFFAESVTPGDYAYVGKKEHQMGRETRTCYSLGTSVFSIEAGKINLIDLSNAGDRRRGVSDFGTGITPADIADLRDVLVGYPNISGEIVVPKRIGQVRFEGGQVVFGSGCPKGDDLEFVPS